MDLETSSVFLGFLWMVQFSYGNHGQISYGIGQPQEDHHLRLTQKDLRGFKGKVLKCDDNLAAAALKRPTWSWGEEGSRVKWSPLTLGAQLSALHNTPTRVAGGCHEARGSVSHTTPQLTAAAAAPFTASLLTTPGVGLSCCLHQSSPTSA